jgi:hypothetical protein
MQLNKASKKTSKSAEKAAAPVAEKPAVADVPKPRATRSSKTKKSEGIEMTSGKNLHKPASPAIVTPQTETPNLTASTPHVEAKPITRPVAPVAIEEIAKLAYSYWVERGYAHGGAQEDWLRAERELAAH